jgi:alkylation response protein AidB-like acyl-CoA dehydrogenase
LRDNTTFRLFITNHSQPMPWHRDAKIYDIFEGTEQIQQLVISRAISGMRIE